MHSTSVYRLGHLYYLSVVVILCVVASKYLRPHGVREGELLGRIVPWINGSGLLVEFQCRPGISTRYRSIFHVFALVVGVRVLNILARVGGQSGKAAHDRTMSREVRSTSLGSKGFDTDGEYYLLRFSCYIVCCGLPPL